MAVEMDFVADLRAHLRAELVAMGFAEAADASRVTEERVGILYFNARLRMIDPRPRTVKRSPLYARTLPTAHRFKVQALMKRVTRGEDLRPFQTRSVVHRRLQRNDGMLNDWGIHHLHLDATGTPTVLMCHVTDSALYAIGFWPHERWTSFEVVRAMLDFWPELFESRRINGVTHSDLSEGEYANLRSKNANTTFSHAGKVYAGIGGGLVSSGANAEATVAYDRLVFKLTNLQKQVQEEFEKKSVEDSCRVVLLFDGIEPVSLLVPSTGHRIALVGATTPPRVRR